MTKTKFRIYHVRHEGAFTWDVTSCESSGTFVPFKTRREARAASKSYQSWRPEMFVEGQWSANGLRFATEAEALASASDLYSRWTMPTAYRAMPSPDPVNYKRENKTDVRIQKPEEAAA